MGVSQPLRGGTNKLYNVIAGFSGGIDKKTTDDVASDSSFENLINFYGESEGALSKRPGVYNNNFTTFIKGIVNEEYSDKFRIINNEFGEDKATVIEKLRDFYNTILCSLPKTGNGKTFQFDKLVGLQTTLNNKFLEALQDYETLFKGDYSYVVGSNLVEFACIFIGSGNCGNDNALYLTRLKFIITYNDGYDVKIEIDTEDPTKSSGNYTKWLYNPIDYNKANNTPGPIDIASYNGYSYIPTGRDYLIKIDQNPITKDNTFSIIGGPNQENVYEPTVLELTQIGFNILANNPISHYKNTGDSDKIRGVFYSITIKENVETPFEQPILQVPYNGEFNIHVLYTSSNKPSTPQYRADNGETDVEKNPYKDLPGNWNEDKTIFTCTGLNSSQSFELKITLESDVFISYFTTTSSVIDKTGYITTINDLIYSSTHAKVINNQLVLYGGHGYMFFSEYDEFTYFPNYFYVYIASEAGEEEVTGVNYFRQYYAIFTNKRIKKMSGTFGADDFGIYPLNDFIGCINGNTIRAVGNNLLFLGNDGIYKLKQGYVGEGTENVEKIDTVINGELNISNVLQAFVMNNHYIVVRNDGTSWYIYNNETSAFYEYNLESETGQVYKGDYLDEDIKKQSLPFYSVFAASLYDANGDFLLVPMYNYEFNDDYTVATKKGMEMMVFRFSDLDFINEDKRHKDGYGFVSTLETHQLNMGYPTHNKKFKEVYIKINNEAGRTIPFYVTIIVDDNTIVSPDEYKIEYDKNTDTYYYIRTAAKNYEFNVGSVLGEFKLGEDKLGNKTVQQIKIRVGAQGKGIKIKLSDGFNDTTGIEQKGIPNRTRNNYKFKITTIGIVYKLKKVKEG